MKKRIYSVLLVLCMLFSLLTITAAAEQSASFSVSATGNVEVGGTVSVSVSLSSVEDGRYFQCRLNYDTSLLKYVSHDAGSYSSNHSEGIVSVAYFNMAPESLGGTILTVEFEAIAEGTASFSLSDCKVGAGEVAADISASGSGDSTVIEAPHVCAPKFVEEDPASCTETGTKAHYACACGKLYSDAEGTIEMTASELEIGKLPHDYQWVVDQAATEDAIGLKHEECSVCHDKRNEGTEIPKLDHEHVLTKVEAVAPTCGKPGNVEYYICSDDDCADICFDEDGNVINDVVIPATGEHKYENGVCTECGAAKPSDPITPAPTPDDDKEEEKKPTFIDVLPGAYYYDAVEWAVAEGITNGITATTFCPDMVCTRAQMVTFLWRAAGSPAPESSEMPFKDVAAGTYYYNAVLWAVENGITNGTSATTFSPDATVTRAQTVTFLWRMKKAPDATGKMVFSDVKQDAYYTEAVLWAVEEGITNGTSATTFSPDAGCTRAQIVTFLYRCMSE